ncbi:hypothetical protein [Vibrio cyclitrophicus]|uniref:hypothetical protein n=1 Tax=Vibrio cyclitrophicus TaxID=47951 RepID=UPI000C84CF05|nr:hypothetical protein [Vibrio cyclitrophicus]PMH74906.1 hypothetical protein BCU59_19410 [Vibrio cyclitrophicus]
MSTLEKLIQPEQFTKYVQEKSVKRSALYQSGAVVTSELVQSKANGGGLAVQIPVWKDLADTDPNLSTDDISVMATPNDVTAVLMKTRVANLNNGWSSIDLANELSGVDASQMITNRVGDYWTRVFNKRLVASLEGVQADSVANHGGDMVIDKADEAFSYDHLIDAALTMSENLDQMKMLVVHPNVFGGISKAAKGNGEIKLEYRRIEELDMSIAVYGGLALLVDSTVPVDKTDPANPVYTTFMLGNGAVAAAFGTPMNALEIDRQAPAGNGGGAEVVWSRVSPIIHPLGFDWTDTAVAGQSPTLAELKDEANWTRKLERENIPVAFIKSLA